MKTLFLYRTQKKKKYFTKLVNNSFKDKLVVIKSYNYLCLNKGLFGIFSKKDKKELFIDLDKNLDKAVSEVFKDRTFLCANLLKAIYTKLICLKIYGLYYGLNKILNSNQYKKIVIWNGLKYQDLVLKSVLKSLKTTKNSKAELIFMENGFFPDTTFISNKGINAGAMLPKNKDFYTDIKIKSTPDFKKIKGRAFKKTSQQNKSLESNALTSNALEGYVLLPFQMERDSQILDYSPWVKNMSDLFQTTLEALQKSSLNDKTLLIREHPSTHTVYDKLYNQQTEKVIFNTKMDYNEALEKASVVVTVNSSVGFEALIKEKTVIVLGEAYYNIDGLCLSAKNSEELITAFEKSKSFKINKTLKDHFLSYLYNDILLKGDWKKPSSDHFTSFSERFWNL